jgi:hypothetical protein
MRTRASLALVVLVCALASEAHASGGPGAVYSEFVSTGKVSCNHSRADLVAVLHSGTLNQYGDPLTLARLKLAVRKLLAGGCSKQHPPRNASAISGDRVAHGGNDSFLAGRGLVLILLVAAVALGGWLTKRALSGRS